MVLWISIHLKSEWQTKNLKFSHCDAWIFASTKNLRQGSQQHQQVCVRCLKWHMIFCAHKPNDKTELIQKNVLLQALLLHFSQWICVQTKILLTNSIIKELQKRRLTSISQIWPYISKFLMEARQRSDLPFGKWHY